MAVMKAFIIISMPFVIAEIATGVISFLTGELSIPPVIGLGTVLDAVILAVGVSVLTARTVMTKGKKEEIPGGETSR